MVPEVMCYFDELVGVLVCQALVTGIVRCTKQFIAGIVTPDYSDLFIVELILSNYISRSLSLFSLFVVPFQSVFSSDDII